MKQKPGRQGRDLLDRLSDKFLAGDQCWDWIASKDREGYGRFGTWVDGRKVGTGLAHRVVYELLVGPIQPGLTLDHLCRNRACVRPDHLEPVPSAVNKSRQVSANRQKTHCPRGHPYDGDNLYLDSRGRHCRACWRVRYWDEKELRTQRGAP